MELAVEVKKIPIDFTGILRIKVQMGEEIKDAHFVQNHERYYVNTSHVYTKEKIVLAKELWHSCDVFDHRQITEQQALVLKHIQLINPQGLTKNILGFCGKSGRKFQKLKLCLKNLIVYFLEVTTRLMREEQRSIWASARPLTKSHVAGLSRRLGCLKFSKLIRFKIDSEEGIKGCFFFNAAGGSALLTAVCYTFNHLEDNVVNIMSKNQDCWYSGQ